VHGAVAMKSPPFGYECERRIMYWDVAYDLSNGKGEKSFMSRCYIGNCDIWSGNSIMAHVDLVIITKTSLGEWEEVTME
jgi:hypothetical protein